jgi:hypothetical protein
MLVAVVLAGCHHEPAYQPAELPPPPGPPIVVGESEEAPSSGVAEAQPSAPVTSVTPWSPPPPMAGTMPAAPSPPVDQASGGRWVYSADYGWLWVPTGSTTAEIDGVPYTYLYTPAYGWTWYVSPWGLGAYYAGPWVHHAWRPWGWRGVWVAPPHVVVRIGPGGHHRR